MDIKELTDIALVGLTGALVWATIRLAIHTKALSKFTNQLVKIEEKRDASDARRQKTSDLSTALRDAEFVAHIDCVYFALELIRPDLYPKEKVNAIESLHRYKAYIEDIDTRLALDRLCTVFDAVRREKKAYQPNRDQITADLKLIQDRIQWSIDKWRADISNKKSGFEPS